VEFLPRSLLARIQPLLRWTVAAAAIAYISLYLLLAFLRMNVPYDLERLEGSFLEQVGRVLHGQPMFTAPALAYVPMVYTPVYFYVSALAVKLMGFGFTPLRLVSILSSLGCFVVLYRFVQRESSSHYFALVAAGLFAATVRETGDWFELARPDSLYIFLLVLSAYLLRWKRGAAWLVLAGCLAGLSFLTKQTALLVILPLLAYALTLGLRAFAAYAGTAALLAGGVIALLHVASGGWSTFYLFTLTSSFLTSKGHIVLFWINDIFRVLPIAVAFAVLYFLDAAWSEDRRPAWFHLCFGAGMVGASWAYSLNWGAYLNGRLPAYFFLSLAMGLGAWKGVEMLRAHSGDRAAVGRAVVFAALLIQFCVLPYDPRLVIPHRQDRELRRELAARVAQIPGPVWVPNHSYLSAAAGKESFAQILNLCTVLVAGDPQKVAPLRRELHDALRQRRFRAIIQDGEWDRDVVAGVYRADLLENYTKSEEIMYPPGATPRSILGLPAPPRVAFVIFVPKSAEPAP